LAPLVFDSRVKFLLGFAIAAVVLAGILTLIELNLKKKREKRREETAESSLESKLREYLSSDKGPREKLDLIDRLAKKYFKETYGTSLGEDYSSLIESFKKKGKKKEVAFCEAMFEAYYFPENLTEEKLEFLAGLLAGIERDRKKSEELSKEPSFLERMDDSLAGWAGIVARNWRIWREKQKSRRVARRANLERLREQERALNFQKKAEEKRVAEVKEKSIGLGGNSNGKEAKESSRQNVVEFRNLPRKEATPVMQTRILPRSPAGTQGDIARQKKEKILEARKKEELKRIELAEKKKFLEVYRKLKLAEEKRAKRVKELARKGMMELEGEESGADLLYSGVMGG